MVCVCQAYDLEGKTWLRAALLVLQANVFNLFPPVLTAVFLFLQIQLTRPDSAMPCFVLHDPALVPAAKGALNAMAGASEKRCFAVCDSVPRSFRFEYEQVTISPLDALIQTGIFAATAYTLVELLKKQVRTYREPRGAEGGPAVA